MDEGTASVLTQYGFSPGEPITNATIEQLNDQLLQLNSRILEAGRSQRKQLKTDAQANTFQPQSVV